MLRVILAFYDRITEAMAKGIALSKILKLPVKAEIGRMKELSDIERIRGLIPGIEKAVASLEVER
jgi:V/A-type H+-transporting ATPase subunit A